MSAEKIAKRMETAESDSPVSDEVVARVALLLSRSWRRSERGDAQRSAVASKQSPAGVARP